MTNNDWREPLHPLKVVLRDSDAYRIHPIFAVRFQDRDMEYLTINGMFLTWEDIMYAQYFINGEWTTIKSVSRSTDAPTSDT
jgi:hypothetical protein